MDLFKGELTKFKLGFDNNNLGNPVIQGTANGDADLVQELYRTFPKDTDGLAVEERKFLMTFEVSGPFLIDASSTPIETAAPFYDFKFGALAIKLLSAVSTDDESVDQEEQAERDEVNELRQRVTELEDSLRRSEENNTSLKTAVGESDERANTSAEELNSLRAERDDLKTKNDNLMRDLDSATNPRNEEGDLKTAKREEDPLAKNTGQDKTADDDKPSQNDSINDNPSSLHQ